ncbi:MAG: hypothetical protein PVH86_12100 [Thiogranum sp.]
MTHLIDSGQLRTATVQMTTSAAAGKTTDAGSTAATVYDSATKPLSLGQYVCTRSL